MSLTRVETEYGLVEGLRCSVPTTVAFRGIPFAAPPTGVLRWRMPQACAPWSGVKQCFTYAPVCMQPKRDPDSFTAREFYAYQPPCSEDSLYLNVWTPAETASDKLPVMVYLYGGGNVQGYSCKMEAGGDTLCKNGVIYVCAAYRLGVFGFLAHPTLSRENGGGSGNWGLHDQLAALRWVKRNIASFGGDPDNVTVFGQSAGGADLQTLLCCREAEGLIHRAICQSSGGLKSVMAEEPLCQAEARGLYLQSLLGCKSIAEMRAIPAHALLDAVTQTAPDSPLSGGKLPICVDGGIVRTPTTEALSAGRCLRVPLITGCTADEGLLWYEGETERATPAALAGEIERVFGSDAEAARGMYAPKDPFETARCLHEVWGDAMLLGCLRWARSRAAQAQPPTYVYHFTRKPPSADGTAYKGAFHSADLWYTFGNVHRSSRPMTGADFELAQSMTAYWTNFAKSGDPNGVRLPHWQPYGSGSSSVMLLGEHVESGTLDAHRVARTFLNLSV